MHFRVFLAILFTVAATAAMAQPSRTAPVRAQLVDRVVAVVNDEAITQFELDDAKKVVLEQLKKQKVSLPPNDVLDTQVERTIQRIADDNKMSVDDVRKALALDKVSYARYREDIRNEITVQRIREREVDSHITVSDAEVDIYLASLKAQAGSDAEYRVAHILVVVPEQATPDQIEVRRRRAEEALRSIKTGTDFGQVAATFSDAPDALSGGSIGWRSGARLPTIFTEAVRKMNVGDVSPVMRSAAGFHIVKLLEKRTRNDTSVVEQTHARHILIKVNEITSEADAKAKIERLKDRLDSGAKFEDLAKLNSEDLSAAKGGDLGWLNPGDTVPPFEEAMNKLQLKQVSGPVRTSFGWHLIEVLERRKQDVTADRERMQAQIAIRQRKADEAFEDWVRQTRDRAYVEVRLDER